MNLNMNLNVNENLNSFYCGDLCLCVNRRCRFLFFTPSFMDTFGVFLPNFYIFRLKLPNTLSNVSNCYPVLRRHWPESPNWWRDYNFSFFELFYSEFFFRNNRFNDYFFHFIFSSSFSYYSLFCSNFDFYFYCTNYIYFDSIFYSLLCFYDEDFLSTVHFLDVINLLSFLSICVNFLYLKILFSVKFIPYLLIDDYYYQRMLKVRKIIKTYLFFCFPARFFTSIYLYSLLDHIHLYETHAWFFFHYFYARNNILFFNSEITFGFDIQFDYFISKYGYKFGNKFNKVFKWRSSPNHNYISNFHVCKYSYPSDLSILRFFIRSKIKFKFWKSLYFDFFFMYYYLCETPFFFFFYNTPSFFFIFVFVFFFFFYVYYCL